MFLQILFFLLPISVFAASCPPGTTYNSNFHKCYKYISQPVTFLQAERSCESFGGNLVTIASAFENSYISANTVLSSTSYWIGLNLLMSSQWSWINGATSSYLNWAPGQPMDPSAYQCAALRNSDDLWTKELCNSLKSYICQIDSYAVLPTTPPSISGCSDGRCSDPSYTLNPDNCKCYKVHPGYATNYTESAEVCVKEGGTLAVIVSPEENAFIANLTRSIAPDVVKWPWIGLFCAGKFASTCNWIDGTPVIYSNLADPPQANQPIFLNELNELWYSSDYITHGNYVCQTKGIRSPHRLVKKSLLPRN